MLHINEASSWHQGLARRSATPLLHEPDITGSGGVKDRDKYLDAHWLLPEKRVHLFCEPILYFLGLKPPVCPRMGWRVSVSPTMNTPATSSATNGCGAGLQVAYQHARGRILFLHLTELHAFPAVDAHIILGSITHPNHLGRPPVPSCFTFPLPPGQLTNLHCHPPAMHHPFPAFPRPFMCDFHYHSTSRSNSWDSGTLSTRCRTYQFMPYTINDLSNNARCSSDTSVTPPAKAWFCDAAAAAALKAGAIDASHASLQSMPVPGL